MSGEKSREEKLDEIEKTPLSPEITMTIRTRIENMNGGDDPETVVRELSERTGVNPPLIHLWIKAYRNDYWKQELEPTTKFDKLTDSQKNYLVHELDPDDRKTEIRRKFNTVFSDSKITPMTVETLLSYRARLLKEREENLEN